LSAKKHARKGIFLKQPPGATAWHHSPAPKPGPWTWPKPASLMRPRAIASPYKPADRRLVFIAGLVISGAGEKPAFGGYFTNAWRKAPSEPKPSRERRHRIENEPCIGKMARSKRFELLTPRFVVLPRLSTWTRMNTGIF